MTVLESVPTNVSVLSTASVLPFASENVPVVVETVRPLYLPPVISPVVSAIVTAEFWINLPVVPSNLATALSVADAGPTTSPVPDTAAHDPSPRR